MAISIIIRTKNEESTIRQVLQKIFLQDIRHDFELIVVDSGSSDKTLDIARQYNAKVVSIPESKFSYGFSLNYGVHNSSGDIICSLSAHCIPCNNYWLQELVKPIQEGKSHATFGRQVPVLGVNPFEELFLERHFPEDVKREGRVSFSNANCAFIKKMWEEVKFDDYIFSWEDYLWYTLIKDKFVFQYVPSACVIHSHAFSFQRITRTALIDGKAFRYMKNRYNIDILQRTSSLAGKLKYVIEDISSHFIFLLKKRYFSYFFMLPFLKVYMYFNYLRGYHSNTNG
jgi:glycosyltransferase involved in cell wall biosynthesis